MKKDAKSMRAQLLPHLTKKWTPSLLLYVLLPFFIFSEAASSGIVSMTLNQRQLCDLELIMNGGFFPLETFLTQQDYESVVNEMRLSNGALWPIPVVLDLQAKHVDQIKVGETIALRDQEGYVLAQLDVTEIWQPNKELEAVNVYGTTDVDHRGVHYLFNEAGSFYVTGKLTKIQDPLHFDFADLRKTPRDLKTFFSEQGFKNLIGFQTRNFMHGAHMELIGRALAKSDGHLLIHPSVGMADALDIDDLSRIKSYRKIIEHFPEGSATLSLLPLATRMAGPREAVWHALIQKNYGCTHLIMGPDHAGAGMDTKGKPFYQPQEAQELLEKYEKEIGIKMIALSEIVYVEEEGQFKAIDEVEAGQKFFNLSGSLLRKQLQEGLNIPQWVMFPDVVNQLRKTYPPRCEQGFTLFFTGLSGSGKSTIAKAVAVKLSEIQDRPLTMLDGDVIRHHLSSELGFSKEHRSINVRRVGFVASEITKNRGVAICPMIAPYEIDRRAVREMISAFGNFIEIYVSTSVDVCESRDTKGFYRLAKEGKITGFTGVNDPYEEPLHPEITIDTSLYSLEEAVDLILRYLRQIGHID